MSPKRRKTAIILSAIAVALLVIVPGAYYLNILVKENQPQITYSGGTTNTTWSHNFTNYEGYLGGYLGDIHTSAVILEAGYKNSYMNLTLSHIGYNA